MNKLESLGQQRIDYSQREKKLAEDHKKSIDLLNAQSKDRKLRTLASADEEVERMRMKGTERVIANTLVEEEKINRAKESTEDIKKVLDKEMENFRLRTDEERGLVEQSQVEKLGRINEQFSKTAEGRQEDYEKLLLETSNKNKEELSKQNNTYALELQDQTIRNANRLDAVDGSFKERFRNNDLKFQQAIHEQEKRGIKDLEMTDREYRLRKEDQKVSSEKEIAKNKQFYKQTLETLRTDFEKRYNEMQATQKNFLTQVEKGHTDEVRKLINSNSAQKTLLEAKMDDPFYRPLHLNPAVSESEKEYLIKLSVPEHEKGLVQISGADRKLKITMAREFEDRGISDDGAQASSKRYETFSKEIHVPQIVDARKISREWKNGELTFVIPKK